jgi:UDP-GlcNAc3NAcA epimerase
MTVVGVRPQFIKAAVVSRAIVNWNARKDRPPLKEEIVHTGQHYDPLLSECFFQEMGIPDPVVNLDVGSGLHGETTGRMMAGVEREILDRRPDLVLVYGDTNSTLAAALAAAKLHVPVAHVEAGVRSFNRRMPEEVNRVLTDCVSSLLFCPSERSQKQLADEGITRGVHVVGDVVLDALKHYKSRAVPPKRQGPFVLASLHRAENTDDPVRLKNILSAVSRCPMPVILPLHPRTRKAIQMQGLDVTDPIHPIEPLSYLSMLGHLAACEFVITDSGGLGKEAFFSGKKCITVRDETEWVELVEGGSNRVVGADFDAIISAFAWAREPQENRTGPFGDGHAGERIVEILSGTVGFEPLSGLGEGVGYVPR